jgi:hypothetical protein
MKILIVIGGLVTGTALTLLAIWIGVRLARRPPSKDQQDVSPDWLNENVYRDGHDGDHEPWRRG